jgi:uncharacterized protein (DUF302 family)
MGKILIFLLFALLYINANDSYKKTIHEEYVTYEVNDKYSDVIFTLIDEINQNGFIISYRANIGNAIENISSFYKKKPICKNAEKIGFCRQTLSLEMMEVNPDNLMYCPLSIALYEKTDEKDKVKIIYRLSPNLKEDEKIMNRVNNTILEMIETSLEE